MIRLTLRSLGARRLRAFLTAVAVVLGVGLVAGTYVLTDTINRSFSDIFAQANATTDVAIGPRTAIDDPFSEPPPLPEALLARVRVTEGVAAAVGNVFAPISIRDPRGRSVSSGPPSFATSLNSPRFEEFELVRGRFPRAADEIALDRGTAERVCFRLGERVTVVGQEGARRLRLVGIARFGEVSSLAGASIALLGLEEAQRLTGTEGELTGIEVAAAPGVDPDELARRLSAALRDAPVTVRTVEQEGRAQARDLEEQFGFLRTALLVFAGIALFVGAFVIYNTFSITVAQRTRELALLRTLGASRRQVLGAVVGEAALIGLVASILGLLAGLAIAPGIAALFELAGLELPRTGTVVQARTIVVSLLVGVVITTVASVAPALRATRVAPLSALREGLVAPRRPGRTMLVLAAALCALGVAALVAGLFGASGGRAASLIGAGAGLVFLGVALLSPVLVVPLAAVVGVPVQRATGITGRLARENATRNATRTAVTAAALMIGVALVAFVSIFAAGLRGSIDRSVDATFAVDLTVRSEDGFSPLPGAVARVARGVEGVATASPVRFGQAKLDAREGTQPVIGFDPGSIERVYDLRVQEGPQAVVGALGADGVLAGDTFAEDQGLRLGQRLRLLTPTGRRVAYTLRGILDEGEFGLLGGGLVAPNRLLERDFDEDEDAIVLLGFARGAAPAAVRARLDRVLAARFPNAETQDREEVKEQQAGQIGNLLNLIYALLALSVLVSLFGIVNTLALSVYERTRELGLLRAIGTSRRQVRRVVRLEAVITSLIGAVLGIVLGVLFALLIARPLAEEGFTLSFPVLTLLVLLVLAGLLGVLAAIGPARRASRLDVLRALAQE